MSGIRLKIKGDERSNRVDEYEFLRDERLLTYGRTGFKYFRKKGKVW